MRTAAVDRVSDVIAILAASMPAENRGDSAVDEVFSAAIDDLRASEPIDVACAAVGIISTLLVEVASVTGESRDEVLRRIALDFATKFPRGADDISA